MDSAKILQCVTQVRKHLTSLEQLNAEICQSLNEMLCEDDCIDIRDDVQFVLNGGLCKGEQLLTGLLDVLKEVHLHCFSNHQREELLACAERRYLHNIDLLANYNPCGDYTAHDALFDVSEELDFVLPEDSEYDELANDLKYRLGIDIEN